MSLSAADKSFEFRNITFKKFCRRLIGQVTLLECQIGSCSHPQRIFQHLTPLASSRTMMSSTPQTDGKTLPHTFALHRLPKRASPMASLADLHTTWTIEIRNGLTRTMKRHVEKAQALK